MPARQRATRRASLSLFASRFGLPSYLVVPVPVPVLPDGLAPCVEPDAAFEPALPERRAFSRAMHASLSLAGTLAQVAVGSSGRFAGTRSPDVVAVVAVEPAAGALPALVPVGALLCAIAPKDIPSAIATAIVLECLFAMPVSFTNGARDQGPLPTIFCRRQHSGSGRRRMLV